MTQPIAPFDRVNLTLKRINRPLTAIIYPHRLHSLKMSVSQKIKLKPYESQGFRLFQCGFRKPAQDQDANSYRQMLPTANSSQEHN